MYREQGLRRLDRFYDLFDLVDLLEYSCQVQVKKPLVSPYEHLQAFKILIRIYSKHRYIEVLKLAILAE